MPDNFADKLQQDYQGFSAKQKSIVRACLAGLYHLEISLLLLKEFEKEYGKKYAEFEPEDEGVFDIEKKNRITQFVAQNDQAILTCAFHALFGDNQINSYLDLFSRYLALSIGDVDELGEAQVIAQPKGKQHELNGSELQQRIMRINKAIVELKGEVAQLKQETENIVEDIVVEFSGLGSFNKDQLMIEAQTQKRIIQEITAQKNLAAQDSLLTYQDE